MRDRTICGKKFDPSFGEVGLCVFLMGNTVMPAEINSTAACQQLYDLTPSFYAAVKKNDEKVSGVSIRLISESKTAFRERSNVFVRIWKWIARHIWTKEVKFTVGGAQLPIKLYDERSNIAAVRRLFWFALQGVTKVSDGDKQKLLQVMRFALKSDNIVDKQEGDTSCHDLFLAYLKGEDSDLVGPSIPLDKDKGVGDTFIACAQSFKGEKVSNEVFQRLCASFSIIKEELSEEQNGEIIRMLDEILSGQIDVTTNVAETVTTVVEGLRSMREGGITPAQPSLEKTGASILRSIGHFEVSQKDFPELK